MVKCVCGKELPTVPNWLADVSVTFICNHCPSRNVQSITKVDLSAGLIEGASEAGSQAKSAKDDKGADKSKGAQKPGAEKKS